MERSDPNFTIPYDAPSAYELADSSYAPLILGNIWTLAASSAHVRMRTPMAFAANLSFVLKSLPADDTGAARLREQRFRHSRFNAITPCSKK